MLLSPYLCTPFSSCQAGFCGMIFPCSCLAGFLVQFYRLFCGFSYYYLPDCPRQPKRPQPTLSNKKCGKQRKTICSKLILLLRANLRKPFFICKNRSGVWDQQPKKIEPLNQMLAPTNVPRNYQLLKTHVTQEIPCPCSLEQTGWNQIQ